MLSLSVFVNDDNSLNSTDAIISIGCFNTRSVVNKLSLLDHYLHQNNNRFDLLFVTESWLSPNILDSMICNSNFNILRDDRCTGRGGGCFFCTRTALIK